MTKQELHTELINKFVKQNASVYYSNEGLEVGVYYDGVNNIDLLNKVNFFVKNKGFDTKVIGRKYKKLLILC